MCPLYFICHLGDLGACFGGLAIPVSVQGNCWRIFDGKWANWLKLFSAHPPNSLSIHQEKVVVNIIKIIGLNICCLFDMLMATPLHCIVHRPLHTTHFTVHLPQHYSLYCIPSTTHYTLHHCNHPAEDDILHYTLYSTLRRCVSLGDENDNMELLSVGTEKYF